MPELPEVEVVCRGLRPLLVGKTLAQVRTSGLSLRLPMPEAALRCCGVGATVVEVRRRAKYLIIVLDNQVRLVIHLGMTGRLGLFPADSPLAAHDHLGVRFTDGLELRFNDTRRFGSIQLLTPEQDETVHFAALGPEPLLEEFSADYLAGKGARRSQPVKNFLMDGRVVVGIGNIYASEILHEAGISPLKPSNQLSLEEWKALVNQSRSVLRRAIAAGGSTIADFANASGRPGYFQLKLKVYGRSGKACLRCGAMVAKVRLAGRSTFYCEGCQR